MMIQAGLLTMFESVTSTIYYNFCSDLASCSTDFLLLICNRDKGRTIGQTKGPSSKATQESKSFLDVELSFQKTMNQTTKTIKEIEK